MNVGRAKEIVASPEILNVTYEGTPIMIQHIDEKTEMARVYPLNDPGNEQDVPVGMLKEE